MGLAVPLAEGAARSVPVCPVLQEWYEEHARKQEEQQQLSDSGVPATQQLPGSRQRSQTIT